MGQTVFINGREIGFGKPTYVIAELSANHLQNYERAVKLIETAVEAGADAVKLGTFTPDTLTLKSDRPEFVIKDGPWAGRTLWDLYHECYMPWEWQPKLKRVAKDLGVDLFSSPFDFTAVDFLEEMDVPAYKIASFELVDIPLIRHAASKGKPVILSTGMATANEIEEARQAASAASPDRDNPIGIVLLHCVSDYPSRPEVMNLRRVTSLQNRFTDCLVGLSDHSFGSDAAALSVALGASVIEKHLTLKRGDGGPDSGFSSEPDEFVAMVKSVRNAEMMLGSANSDHTAGEKAHRPLRRSLFAAVGIRAGESLTPENIRSIRPGDGLAPVHYDKILGRRAVRDIELGEPLRWEMID